MRTAALALLASLSLTLTSAAPHALADDSARLAALFETAAERGGAVTIPPGDYRLDGDRPIRLASHTRVSAHGARFLLPERLGDRARAVLFAGEDIRDFRWTGGLFLGRVFDPSRAENPWEPNANTRGILITTTPGGRTEDLAFRDIRSDGLAGAVVTVLGAVQPGSDREVHTYARNVTIEDCTLERSGKFMWDYGYLWQITVWPEDHTEAERAMAGRYFRRDLVRGPLRLAAGDDRVFLDGAAPPPVTASDDRGRGAVCFFGDALPANLVRGRQYFVVESTPEFVRVAERPGGPPIRFEGAAGPGAMLIADLFAAHPALYAPTGSGPGKGAFDLVACEDVVVRGCRLSALGDTMHIQKCRGVTFTGNHITGSRMGAFFLAEFCRDATITGNTVDGTNGSRVVSVEKSCEDVTIVGNTFRNGGRGSWINQPRNFVLAHNIFVDNTTKCEPDPRRGRRSFVTGGYEQYAELYFTTHEPGGRYGNVAVIGNVFTSGDSAAHALTFAPGGERLLVADNIFQGRVRTIAPPVGCADVILRDNLGAEVQETPGRSAGPAPSPRP